MTGKIRHSGAAGDWGNDPETPASQGAPMGPAVLKHTAQREQLGCSQAPPETERSPAEVFSSCYSEVLSAGSVLRAPGRLSSQGH